MVSVILTMVFIVHVVTCLWFLVAVFQNFNIFTWVGSNNYSDSPIYSQYLASVYWTY